MRIERSCIRMKIYRIHTLQEDMYYSGYTDDYEPIEKDITIKYVNSLEKVKQFLKDIETRNKEIESSPCMKCPVWNLTKRKYNKNPSLISDYCKESDIDFNGNTICCKNLLIKEMDFNEYYYEEIEVE
jgi:hypothetical protein